MSLFSLAVQHSTSRRLTARYARQWLSNHRPPRTLCRTLPTSHLAFYPMPIPPESLFITVTTQRTLDEDCRQAEEPKQLADEASRFHLGRQRQHSAVICSGALLFSSRVLRPSLVMLCSHKSGRCTVELYHASHLWYPPFYTSPMASSALQH